MAKVSIVLPTYNGEKYIRESIDSVINQTFTDWELIIVNDCSTDNTPLIIQEYANQDSRIKVIHNRTNQKLPKSLNIGFTYAEGEYLSWTSDDNYYLPNAIEKMSQYLDMQKDTYLVCADMYYINANGIVTGRFARYNSDSMCFSNCVGACFMYRKKVLEKIGGYDLNMFLIEDYDYWLRILFEFGTIGYIDEPLYAYRFHADSLTGSRMAEIRKQTCVLRRKHLNWILENANKEGICRVYCEFLEAKEDISDIRDLFVKAVPELQLEKEFDSSKKVIIYGAGTYGERLYEMIKEQVAFFADRDLRKIGKEKNGVYIISLEEMVCLKSEYQIVLAGNGSLIYGMLRFLNDNNVHTCTLYHRFDVNILHNE